MAFVDEDCMDTYYSKNLNKVKAYARTRGNELRRKRRRQARIDNIAQVRKERREKQAAHYARQKDAVRELKRNNPCSCGVSDPDLLVFHHRIPKDKENSIASMFGGSKKKLMAEIEKCDIVCRNCHVKLHETPLV